MKIQGSSDPASLQNLNDIVAPEPISLWWPLAPGWWILLGLIAGLGLSVGWRGWRLYRRNAYRREAERLLKGASDPQAVSTLLKRVALVLAPRDEVAGLSGEAWVNWLARRSPVPMPGDVAETLRSGIYGSSMSGTEPLRHYAREWIRSHQSPKN